ncbi:MAG: hypothetical protein IKU35_06575 [Bacteroidaceae bacterium]|nr:hypothetical protein [Bacteroidaceae bacterium]
METTKYGLKVIICDPNTKEGMNSDLFFDLDDCAICYDPADYGNGCVAYIGSRDGFFDLHRNICIDLRYEKGFRKEDAEAWFEKWAREYWNGEGGNYTVKRIVITKEVVR